MSHPGRIIRRALIAIVSVAGVAAAAFVIAVLVKVTMHVRSVQAASAIINPSFCLGGWDHPQNASGQSKTDILAKYSRSNSAYLSSEISSQLFCGYFNISDKANPPSRVAVHFNWDMRQTMTPPPQPFDQPLQASTTFVTPPVSTASSSSFQTPPQSYTVISATSTTSTPPISPATGFTVVPPPPPSPTTTLPVQTPPDSTTTTNTTTTVVTPPAGSSDTSGGSTVTSPPCLSVAPCILTTA